VIAAIRGAGILPAIFGGATLTKIRGLEAAARLIAMNEVHS
jgi:hypothetical protein